MQDETAENVVLGGVITFALAVLAGLIILLMWGCPKYSVYEQSMSGQAKLAEANSSRQVAIAEAHAKEEAAKYLAAADTLRAHGVAESNRIIGQSLRENEDYLTWLFIESLKETKDQVIYIPTQGSLPVLEAARGIKLLPARPQK